MRLLKSHTLLRLVNSYIVDSPQPANISYLWNFGSLLATCLGIQILTGVFLAMHYTPHVDFAFNSVEHIMRDVNAGYILRYTHANVASFFFMFVYAHIARGLFYSSYREPRTLVWSIGVIILVVMMATAFLGYKHSPKWSKFNAAAQPQHKGKEGRHKPYCVANSILRSFCLPGIKQKISQNIKFSRGYTTQTPCLHPSLALCFTAPASLPRAYAQGVGRGGVGEYNSNTLRQLNSSPYPSLQQGKALNEFIENKKLTPIYTYENLQLDETKKQILQETKNLSGIYLILNKITLDYYIGSASTGKFFARFSNHLIYFRGSKIVKLAVKKYKLTNFAFLILELFPEIVNKENNKKLLDVEDFYLKTMLPNYNILTEAGSSFGYKHTELDRIKMKSNYSLERRLQIGNLNRGKKLSSAPQETIAPQEKIREKTCCAASREKVQYSAAAAQQQRSLLNMKKNSKPVILYNLDYTVFGEYSSITEAANSINCAVKTIYRSLKTEKKLLKRRFIVNLSHP